MPMEPKRIDVTMTMWLSVPTFGIYGLIQFYRIMRIYHSHLVRDERNQDTNNEVLFWIYIGACVLGIAFLPFTVGAIILGAILLNNVLSDRNKVMAQQEYPAIESKWSEGGHISCWVIGNILAILLIGIVLLILQAIQFFKEYNSFADMYWSRRDQNEAPVNIRLH